MAARTYLFAVSLGAHAVLGAALAAIPARVRHEVIGIAMVETPKPKPPVPVEPPPLPEAPRTQVHAARAKAAAPPAPTAAAPVDRAPASSPADAPPDFGITQSNGTGPGLAVPAAHAAEPLPAPAATKTLARAAHAPVDDCDEPPTKPRPLGHPTPAYTADARAAGIAGKVRVEITVDERGRVVAVRVAQGLGHGLDEAALAAARAMTFEPAQRCGRPTSATFRVGFTFSAGTP